MMEFRDTKTSLRDIRRLKLEEEKEMNLSEQEKELSNAIDTLDLENSNHRAYAAGFMMVRPGIKPEKSDIQLFYTDEYDLLVDNPDDFEEKSTVMLKSFINAIIKAGKKERRVTVAYFHNLAGFDGILILKNLALNLHNEISFQTLFRNGVLYSIDVKTIPKGGFNKKGRTIVKFLDSCKLLPSNLESLGKSFAPELGGKGEMDYLKVNISNLTMKKRDYLQYLEKDILLTAAILQKAQEIYFQLYNVDITEVITISSMALRIFRTKYYDDSKEETRIYIPDDNQDRFIRGGYYGGHTDVYIPYGENLKLYDVNSLYPYIMQNCLMPGGRGEWLSDLRNAKLENLFGFVKAMVVCPKDMNRPFLPYKENTGQLIFPTGLFLGVYWSEELKYAEKLGYKVYPLQALQYKMIKTPFKEFINDLYNQRLEAKKNGDEALSFVLKTTMNSLYGRFGISPESTKTEIAVSKEEFEAGIEKEGYYDFRPLGNDTYVMMYKQSRRAEDILDDIKKDLSNSAVHISAAITAYARIYMYPHISREDCYYTDTDSIVIKGSLKEDMISPTEIGKFKIEYDNIESAIFDAPKEYMLVIGLPDTDEKKNVIKFKGVGHDAADPEWFRKRAENPGYKQTVIYRNYFCKDFKNLEIGYRKSKVTMGEEKEKKKREPVYDGKRIVGTKPRHLNVDDLRSLDHRAVKILVHLLSKHDDLKKILDDNGIAYEETKPFIRPDEKETYKSSIETVSDSIETVSSKIEIVSDSKDSLYDDIDDDESGI